MALAMIPLRSILFIRKQIFQNDGLVDDAGVLTFCNTHGCQHHQLNAVCLVVHLACSISIYLVQDAFFIRECDGIFASCELYLAALSLRKSSKSSSISFFLPIIPLIVILLLFFCKNTKKYDCRKIKHINHYIITFI